MKLYHGTDANNVEEILDSGLKPRNATGRSNWDHNDMESLPGHVYLTDKYGPYFGMAAAEGETAEKFALFEIDLDPLNQFDLYPDEDFVEQAMQSPDFPVEKPANLDLSGDIVSRTKEVRENIEQFQPYWELSMKTLGNISHQGEIPPEAISRVSVVEPPGYLRLAIDPNISLRAAALTGQKYKMYTRLFMGDDVSKREYLIHTLGVPIPSDGDAEEMISEEEVEELIGSVSDQMKEQAEKALTQDYISVQKAP